jgi:pseudouridine-5'-phosphate glycosidase
MPIDLRIAEEVAAALAEGRPVVALESTIITHGMPYPANVETAQGVEAVVRRGGAVPATVAVLDGRVHVGLTPAETDGLGRTAGVMKLSRADLAFALAMGRTGATTVAATMILAHLAGIGVFATGGIGGVHRGAETNFDVSADLHELARTPVVVVCAGAKAILDIPKTLEVLETLGVPVVGYRSDRFPAFWSRDSGQPAPFRLDSAAEIARLRLGQSALGFAGGVLVANPIPEEAEIPRAVIEGWIAGALGDAAARGIAGKDVTPFLLGRMLELSEGRSLVANIALIRSNAALAAEVAVELATG